MDKRKHLAAPCPRQALAHHDLKPPFLPRRCVRGLDVTTVDADGTKGISCRQAKFVEHRMARRPLMRLLVETAADSRHVPLPRRDAGGLLQRQNGVEDSRR